VADRAFVRLAMTMPVCHESRLSREFLPAHFTAERTLVGVESQVVSQRSRHRKRTSTQVALMILRPAVGEQMFTHILHELPANSALFPSCRISRLIPAFASSIDDLVSQIWRYIYVKMTGQVAL